jgi:hypothetical protein
MGEFVGDQVGPIIDDNAAGVNHEGDGLGI